jgi:hypothetical protein
MINILELVSNTLADTMFDNILTKVLTHYILTLNEWDKIILIFVTGPKTLHVIGPIESINGLI